MIIEMEKFRVYKTKDILFYSLYDELYDAMTLQHLNFDPQNLKELEGLVDQDFGTNPYVYMDKVIYRLSSGKYVEYNKAEIYVYDETMLCEILIPDIHHSNFVERKVKSMFPPNVPVKSKTVVIQEPVKVEPEAVKTVFIPIQSPVEPSKPAPVKKEDDEIRELLILLCTRLYCAKQPEVEIPEKYTHNKIKIELADLKKKVDAGEITDFEIEPLLQLYAGNHRSPKRTFTCYDKNGKIYSIRTIWNPETGQIKFS